jgi:hypothetical protein
MNKEINQMQQESAKEYMERLVKKADILAKRIDDEWDILTLVEVDDICEKLGLIQDDARRVYEELESDELDIASLLHHIEYVTQDAEELLKEKESQQ